MYTSLVRRISVAREGKEPLILVTNLLDEPAEIIAELYKSRWEVELFFKWIKQRLKIKKFLGKSENAVRIQLITAIIAYILVFLFKNNCIQCWPMYLLIIWIKSNIDKPLDTALSVLSLKQKPPQILKLQEALCQHHHGCPPNAGKTLTGQ